MVLPGWLNAQRPFLQKGDDAYLVIVSNYANLPSHKLLTQFENCLPPVVITQYRSGTAVRNFFIYRLKSYNGKLPLNGLLEED
jgi:hypothetical protein